MCSRNAAPWRRGVARLPPCSISTASRRPNHSPLSPPAPFSKRSDHAERLLCMQWPVWGSEASACAMAWPGVACLARSSLQGVPAARQPPPLCPARHLAAALHFLVARAERLLCACWPVWGSDASACAMAWPGVAWLARSGFQGVPAARQPPLLCPAIPSRFPPLPRVLCHNGAQCYTAALCTLASMFLLLEIRSDCTLVHTWGS